MDFEPFRKIFLEDAAPLKVRIEHALLHLNELDQDGLKQLYLDSHNLKGGYLQFGMIQEAAWAADIEQRASVLRKKIEK